MSREVAHQLEGCKTRRQMRGHRLAALFQGEELGLLTGIGGSGRVRQLSKVSSSTDLSRSEGSIVGSVSNIDPKDSPQICRSG